MHTNGRDRRILFLIGAQNFGGAERQLAALAKGLHRNGRAVAVAVCHPGRPLKDELTEAGVRVVDLGRHGRFGAIGFLWRTVRAIRSERPTVMHGYLHGPNLLAILLKPFARRSKVVWGIRDSNMDRTRYTWLHRIKFRITRMMAQRADLIIANSEVGAEYHRELGYPPARTVVVPNGIDTERFRPDPQARDAVRSEWGLGTDDLAIGLVARLDPMKDHGTFLAAAALVAQAVPRAKFVCVGDGPPEYRTELEAMTEALGLQDRVVWVGGRQDMEAVQNALDVACSASAFGEGFSNALGEAMACGVPCVATEVGDSAVVIGETGFVVPPRDPRSLAHSLIRMCSDLSPERKRACRERMERSFSVPRLVERTEQLLWSAP